MKQFPLVLLLVSLTFPNLTLAHTSDERYVDGYVVDLSTAPIAPWVGEKMGMSFSFLDPFTFRATTTVVGSATLEIDAVFRANGKRQATVYTSPLLEVVDSGIMTSYIFTEEGTYDLHLTFTDSSGKTHAAGFRKQVRLGEPLPPRGATPFVFFSTLILIGVLTFIAGRLSRKK